MYLESLGTAGTEHSITSFDKNASDAHRKKRNAVDMNQNVVKNSAKRDTVVPAVINSDVLHIIFRAIQRKVYFLITSKNSQGMNDVHYP